MKNRLCLIPVVFIALLLTTMQAFGGEQSDWAVGERCAIETTDFIPYDGMILASGWAGLHSISSTYETPVIQLFADEKWGIEGSPIDYLRFRQSNFHAFSPDGYWLALVVASIEMDCSPCWQGQVRTSHILIYDTRQRDTPLLVPYQGTYAYGQRPPVHRTFSIRWIDNETLVLPEVGDFVFDSAPPQAVLLNPFDNTTDEPSQSFVSLYNTPAFTTSPDGEKILIQTADAANHADPWQLIDVTDGELITSIDSIDNLDVAWAHESDRMVVVTQEQGERLLLIDVSSGQSEVILAEVDTVYSGPYQTYMAWSHDDRYFAYLADMTDPGDGATGVIHIVDVEQRLIYDTCQIAASFVWSPDRHQIAFAPDASHTTIARQENVNVQVMDVERWQVFTAASHRGHMVAWIR